MSWVTLTRGNQEKNQPNERQEDHHVLHRELRSPRRGHKSKKTSSLDTIPTGQDPARANLVPRKEEEGTMFKLLELSLKE